MSFQSAPTEPPSPKRCAAEIRRAITPLARRLRPNLRRDGISAAKLSLVGRIYRAGAITPTYLAAAEGVRVQSLTRLIAELTADGWVARARDAEDRRQSKLSLTPRGRRRLSEAAFAGETQLAAIIARDLGEADRLALARACRLLTQLEAALGEAGAPAARR